MSQTLNKTVALVGMMGSGKTAVGRALADLLRVQFLDTDHEIETAADRTIAEIFERDGEDFFRDREHEVLTRLLNSEPSVLSTGGGAYMFERNRQAISQTGVAVWLKADPELLWLRVKHKDTRPLLRTANPKATLLNLIKEREPYYAHAEISVAANEAYEIEEMARKVRTALHNAGIVQGDLIDG